LCQPCSTVLKGCITCLSNVACQSCAPRFFNKNGTCLGCDAIVPNCANCSSNGATCNQCKYPYLLVNNTCYSQTIESIIGGANNNPVPPPPFNRTEVLPSGETFIAIIDKNGCNQLQTFTQGKCVKTIANCQVYQPTGFCQICNTGFLVTIFGDCVNNNTQLRCENGFWLNKTSDSCVKVSITCDWFYPNNGSCFNCSINYKLDNGLCVPKVNCTNRQFYSNGVCVDVNRLCSSWSEDGTCLSCYSGYFLSEGRCLQLASSVKVNLCTFPCKTCFNERLDYCFSCSFGYQLKDARFGSCIPILY